MCLLFIYFNPNAGPGEYKVIIANTRDEYYHRPTKSAHFWPNMAIIGGRDEEPGREGGTWFAMNRNGKIASLLNILQPREELSNKDMKGRGFLVNAFLQGKETPLEYLQNVSREGSIYNGFLLVTMDTLSVKPTIAFYTNKSTEEPQTVSPGVHVFGNSPPKRLWEKAVQGKRLFEEVVLNRCKTFHRDSLVGDLQRLIKDPKVYPLDDQIRSQGKGIPELFLSRKNAIFYSIPEINYGSRSHTIILIDSDNRVEYLESCMEEPIDIKGNVTWVNTREVFTLSDNEDEKSKQKK